MSVLCKNVDSTYAMSGISHLPNLAVAVKIPMVKKPPAAANWPTKEGMVLIRLIWESKTNAPPALHVHIARDD